MQVQNRSPSPLVSRDEVYEFARLVAARGIVWTLRLEHYIKRFRPSLPLLPLPRSLEYLSKIVDSFASLRIPAIGSLNRPP